MERRHSKYLQISRRVPPLPALSLGEAQVARRRHCSREPNNNSALVGIFENAVELEEDRNRPAFGP
jgi:hypothetical protein